MRDIRLRAWDFTQNKMLDGSHFMIEGCGSKWRKLDNKMMERIYDDLKLMQYTGLKDKNGVEIYESDLLKIKLNEEETVVATVVFDRGAFNVALSNGNGYTVAYINHEAEVIGNIYENQKLLEKD